MIGYDGTNLLRQVMKIDKRWFAALGLILLAEAWRIYNYQNMIAPGFELVTASTLVAAALLPRRAALVVPLALMVGGDLLIGNTPILLFTWSAFALIGLAGLYLRRWSMQRPKLVLASLGAGIVGSLFFFLFTNFGVWLIGDGTMYAKTWSGLMQCYAMGLPFYRTNILGNIVVVPVFMALAAYTPAWLASFKHLPEPAPTKS